MQRNNYFSWQRGAAKAVLCLLVALPAWAADAQTAKSKAGQSANAQAGKAKVAQCVACHGADGIAKTPDAPNLAGQNETYLVKALKDYKSGARKHEVMSAIARNLPETDIPQVAAYYSSIPVTVKAPRK
jgi:cytochrome c553